MKFNFQPLMNADPGAPEGGPNNETPTAPAFTPEQQAEIDKALQSAQDKIRTEYSRKLKAAEEAKQALEREKMSETERKEAEQKELMEKLAAKEQELLSRELEIKTIDLLKANELPIDFKQFVIGASEETTLEKIQNFKKLWNDALKTAVEGKFKENGRTVIKHADGSTITKEDFAKMSLQERTKLFNENRELYNELKK